MSVDTNIPVNKDLYGKTIGDLQENVSIENGVVTGTLKYVTDYNGFSSNIEERSGNYLALHFNTDTDALVTVTLTDPIVLDVDNVAVLRITDKDSQTITVVAEADGHRNNSMVLNLSGLVCETA